MEIPTVTQVRRSWLQALAFLLLTAATSLGQNTSLTINSQPGDPIGGGASYSFTPAQGTFNAYNSGGVSVSFASPEHYLYLSFAAPASAPLTVGLTRMRCATHSKLPTKADWPSASMGAHRPP